MPLPPRHIGIAGLGLIGTSIALAARRAWPGVRLAGIDRPETSRHSRVASTFESLATDAAALADADLVVLAMPVGAIVAELPGIAAACRPDAVITDTGSTKRAVLAAATGLEGFVGGHPMAGGERGGADHARADLFDGCTWWIVPGAEAPTMTVRAFVEALGAVPVEVDAARHDALVGALSHLPQVVASALMARVGAAVGEEGLAHAGPGLRDTTRLAASPAEMWASVLATNADEVAPLLRELAGDLERLAGHLDDEDAVRRLFADASRRRGLLPR
jgi:prephenate dehydrogenase